LTSLTQFPSALANARVPWLRQGDRGGLVHDQSVLIASLAHDIFYNLDRIVIVVAPYEGIAEFNNYLYF
jgi:hypothetical protein